MNKLRTWLWEEESGQALVEYAVIIALIAIAVSFVLGELGGKIGDVFDKIVSEIYN